MPPQESTLDSDLVSNGSPAGNTAPQKPSLRILDPGPATLEEDLSHGPLLLRMVDGINIRDEQGTTHYPPEIGSELVPEGPVQPGTSSELPLRSFPPTLQSNIPLSTASQSASSAGGRSYSTPADGTSSTGVPPCHQVEGVEEQRQSVSHRLCLFPRNYEFAWENGCLTFARKPFYTDEAARIRSSGTASNSEVASTTIPESHPWSQPNTVGDPEPQQRDSGSPDLTQCLNTSPDSVTMSPGSLAHLSGDEFFVLGSFNVGRSAKSVAPSDVDRDLDILFAAYSVASRMSLSDDAGEEDPHTESQDSVQAFIARENAIDWLVEQLFDNYVRSYARTKPMKGSRAGPSRSSHSTGTGAGGTSRNITRIGRERGSGGRKITNSNEESEDEDSHRDPRKDPRGLPASSNCKSKRLKACPFLRWKPQRHESCGIRQLRNISNLKNHILKAHYQEHCPDCYMTFAKNANPDHNCKGKRPPPAGFITMDKCEAIEVRADGNKSFEEQWRHLYEVLFPNEPVNFKPYLDVDPSEIIGDTQKFVCSESSLEIMREACPSFRDEDLFNFLNTVSERLLPRVVHFCLQGSSNGGALREQAFGDYQTAEPAFHNPTPVADTINPSILQGTGSGSLSQASGLAAATTAYPTLGVEAQHARGQGGSNDALSLEGLYEWNTPNHIIGIEEMGLAGLEVDHGGTPSGSFGYLGEPDNGGTPRGSFGYLGEPDNGGILGGSIGFRGGVGNSRIADESLWFLEETEV